MSTTSEKGLGSFSGGRHRIGVILLAASVGAMTGFIGGIAAEAILPSGAQPPVDGILRRIITPRRDPALPSLTTLAEATVDLFVVPGRAPLPASLPIAQRTGRGVALTSDGWVVTVRAAVPSEVLHGGGTQWIAASGADRRLRSVDRIAVDPISDLIFVRVHDSDATVIPFRATRELDIGTELVVPSVDGGATRTSLRSASAPSSDLRTSDVWTLALRLSSAVDAPPGTPVVDRNGALVGVLSDATSVIPADAITSATASLFARGVVERNILGLTYHDLADEVRNDRGPASGLMLAAGDWAPAIAPSSPLVRELRAGDVITAIGDDTLTVRRTLPELLQEYPLGAEVQIRVLRNGKTGNVSARLATARGGVYVSGLSETPERLKKSRKSGGG